MLHTTAHRSVTRRLCACSVHLMSESTAPTAAAAQVALAAGGPMVALAITGTLQEGFWLRPNLDFGGVPARYVCADRGYHHASR